jgi:hypothetical protein
MQSEPLKTGFLVEEMDAFPSDLPIKLRFPNGSLTRSGNNTIDVSFGGGSSNPLWIDETNGVGFSYDGIDTVTLLIHNLAVQSWTKILVVTTSNFLLETGDYFLLETGDRFLLEN